MKIMYGHEAMSEAERLARRFVIHRFDLDVRRTYWAAIVAGASAFHRWRDSGFPFRRALDARGEPRSRRTNSGHVEGSPEGIPGLSSDIRARTGLPQNHEPMAEDAEIVYPGL